MAGDFNLYEFTKSLSLAGWAAVILVMIYWFSDLLGFDEYFESKKPHHVEKIRTKLEHPLGLGFVSLWAFFPLVPTDAVCYVAGSIRMHFAKFIAAVFIGELILCSVYVFAGGRIFSMFS